MEWQAMKGLKGSLKRYFLTGLLVITPIWGTVLILKTLFVTVDSFLGTVLADFVLQDYYVPGLGILTLLVLIFFAGVLTANFIGHKLVKQWEDFLDRVPFVRGIYATLKSIVDILSFKQRDKYDKVVMIQFPKNGHYCLAFVTGETCQTVQQLVPDTVVHVFVPTSPNPTSGYFLLVPEKEVVPVDLSVEEAMKLIVSGGLYSPNRAGGTDFLVKPYVNMSPTSELKVPTSS
ncbi:MAG: DUF502 domain-containing protein [Nitrospirae bacterium]|nr:MAG: DUF502 domain-containing protein [Nitrospirota bacterium]